MQIRFEILYLHSINLVLVGYYDVDWAGSANDRKNTSNGCFFLGNNLISWFNKKQSCVLLSTVKAEYIPARSSSTQFL